MATSRVYQAGIKRYVELCHQLSTPPTPASEELLCNFVAYLGIKNVSSGTIKVYLSAVRQLHIRKGKPPPPTADMARLNQVLRGVKIAQASDSQVAKAKQRLPITPDILRQIKGRWKKEPPSQDKIMLWAAFLTCFFGFFRSGEICSVATDSRGLSETPDLSVDSLEIDNFWDPHVVKLHLQRSKTDPFREGTTINIPCTGDDLCPVAALLSWLVYRGQAPGPLFFMQSGTPLTPPRLVTELRGVLRELGLEAEHFSGHSFWRGAATTAAAQGVTDSQILKITRPMEKFSIPMLLTPLDVGHGQLGCTAVEGTREGND